MTKTAVGADDDDDDRSELERSWQVPPGLFRLSEVMADHNAALAQQMLAALRPQVPALEGMQAMFRQMAASYSTASLPAVEHISTSFAASMLRALQTPAWQEIIEHLDRQQVPPLGDWLTPEDPAATDPGNEELVAEAAERLHGAGVTAVDLDRYALLLFALRMMSLGGVVAGGVLFGGAALLTSFPAFVDFLSQLRKMRQRLAELEDGDDK